MRSADWPERVRPQCEAGSPTRWAGLPEVDQEGRARRGTWSSGYYHKSPDFWIKSWVQRMYNPESVDFFRIVMIFALREWLWNLPDTFIFLDELRRQSRYEHMYSIQSVTWTSKLLCRITSWWNKWVESNLKKCIGYALGSSIKNWLV